MHFSQNILSLAALTFLACTGTAIPPEKESVCCKEVSSKKITQPITGFKLQQASPPCVKAVIFYTAEGAVCSHWRANWVKSKVTELRKLQAFEKGPKKNTTTIVPQTTAPTHSFKTTASNN